MNFIAGTDDSDGNANLTLEQIVEWDPENIIFEISPTWMPCIPIRYGQVFLLSKIIRFTTIRPA